MMRMPVLVGLVATVIFAGFAPAVMADDAAPAAAAASQPAAPEAAAVKPGLKIELNALAPSQKGCAMTFVAENTLATDIAKLSLELAFFNGKSTVDKVTVVDFRDLPVGKTRVRQFDMPNIKCDQLSKVIVNDAPVCTGPATGECMKGLVTDSKLSIPFQG